MNYGYYDYYIAEYFGSVIFHVNYLSYLPVFLCLYCTLLRAAGDGCGAVTGDCSAVTTAGRVLDRGPLLPRAAAARDLDCVCRDVAAGRRDADGRHVPGRHGHAAALPIAAPSAPPRARRAKVGARLFRIYVRLTVVCPTLVAKRGEGN